MRTTAHLAPEPGPLVLCIEATGNTKTGPMPATYSDRTTCPPACPLVGWCYAEDLRTRKPWDRAAGPKARSWPDFMRWVAAMRSNELWRYGIGGDLPGQGDRLDLLRCVELARAGAHTAPIAFTHYPMQAKDVRASSDPAERARIARHNRMVLRAMVTAGFLVNVSANGEGHAAELVRFGFPVVAITHRAMGQAARVELADGSPARICPASIRPGQVTCKRCGLCAKPRASVLLFPAHGNKAARARALALEA